MNQEMRRGERSETGAAAVTATLTAGGREQAATPVRPVQISVIVLTFNSELTIGQTLDSARQIADDIHVVDSFSTDHTLQIVAARGAQIVQHPFVHYGDQRNWAIDHLPLKYGWQLHLDADEYLSPELIAEIQALTADGCESVSGFYVPRLTRFLGREIRHGGHYPTWHLRLFRNGTGRCESRRYDQHFILNGTARRLHAPMIDDNRMSLREWTERHNRWSDAEVAEVLHPTKDGVIAGKLRGGSPMQRKRGLRAIFLRVPPFTRSFLFFVYRYVLRLGFLDGKPGLIYNVLQTFWYRFLIDAKLYEHSLQEGHEQRNKG